MNCHNQKETAYKLANPEATQAINKKSYANNRANRILNSKKWLVNNPDKRKIIEAKYRANNRQIVQARSEAWRLLHPNKTKEYKLKRRARLENNGEFVILEKEINKLYSSNCFYCGSNKRIEADHIIPISKGGRHSIGNLVPACRWCNAKKGNRFITTWQQSKERE